MPNMPSPPDPPYLDLTVEGDSLGDCEQLAWRMVYQFYGAEWPVEGQSNPTAYLVPPGHLLAVLAELDGMEVAVTVAGDIASAHGRFKVQYRYRTEPRR